MILIDTHIVSWLAFEPASLSKKAVEAIVDARRSGTGLAIAAITLWELGMMVARKRIKPAMSLEGFLQEIEENFTVLPVTAAVAARSMSFSENFPNDPADQLIGATALAHGIFLVTADEKIRKSKEVPCIW